MRAAFVIALLGAAVLLAIRGPIFGLSHASDYLLIYAPARALLMGGDPYDARAVDEAWLEAGGPVELRPSQREDAALLYPPTTLALLAPFAALPWSISRPLWMVSNVVLLGVAIAFVSRLAGFRANQSRTLVFVLAAMLFMPVHTTFRVGQTSLLVLALIAAGFALMRRNAPEQNARRGGDAFSGALIGLASLLKPQIGVPFLALQVLWRRWRVVMVAIISAIIVIPVSIVPMMARGIPWWSNWQINLERFTGGNVGDPTASNPVRHQLLNLHYPLHVFIENRAAVNVLVLLIVGGLAMVFFRFWFLVFGFWIVGRRSSSPGPIHNPKSKIQNPDALLSLSMVAVLSLMIVYHRYYDAALLLLPLAWAIGAVSSGRRPVLGWCLLILSVPIFVNWATVMKYVEARAALPAWMLDEWWWNGLLMPLQAWSLLLMSVAMTVATLRRSSGT